MHSLQVFWIVVTSVSASGNWDRLFSGPNLALGETAELFPSSSAASSAYKAVDGNTSDAASSGACAQTTNSPHVWWQIYLGRPYFPTGIKIFNRERGELRTNLRGMRIQGFTQFRDVAFDINGFDANGTSCTNDNAGLNGSSVCDDVILIPINSRQKVKFVKISANDTVLTLCEVQVFAVPVCHVMYVSGAIANTSRCVSEDICKSGTIVTYICDGLFAYISSPVCMDNETWSHRPECPSFEYFPILVLAGLMPVFTTIVAIVAFIVLHRRRRPINSSKPATKPAEQHENTDIDYGSMMDQKKCSSDEQTEKGTCTQEVEGMRRQQHHEALVNTVDEHATCIQGEVEGMRRQQNHEALVKTADEHATCTEGEVEGTRRQQYHEALVKTADEHGPCTDEEVEGTRRQQHHEALNKTADEHATCIHGEVEGMRRQQHHETIVKTADEHATCTDGEVEGRRRQQHHEALVNTVDEHATCIHGEVEGMRRQQHHEALVNTVDEHERCGALRSTPSKVALETDLCHANEDN